MENYICIVDSVVLGKNVRLAKFINLYGCAIGDNSRIGAFVEIQKNAVIGANCKISSHTFICEGVTIGDNCFIGHGVMFINDNHPRRPMKRARPNRKPIGPQGSLRPALATMSPSARTRPFLAA